jgi:hypothetical protein
MHIPSLRFQMDAIVQCLSITGEDVTRAPKFPRAYLTVFFSKARAVLKEQSPSIERAFFQGFMDGLTSTFEHGHGRWTTGALARDADLMVEQTFHFPAFASALAHRRLRQSAGRGGEADAYTPAIQHRVPQVAPGLLSEVAARITRDAATGIAPQWTSGFWTGAMRPYFMGSLTGDEPQRLSSVIQGAWRGVFDALNDGTAFDFDLGQMVESFVTWGSKGTHAQQEWVAASLVTGFEKFNVNRIKNASAATDSATATPSFRASLALAEKALVGCGLSARPASAPKDPAGD